jgi:hypothetical protein
VSILPDKDAWVFCHKKGWNNHRQKNPAKSDKSSRGWALSHSKRMTYQGLNINK